MRSDYWIEVEKLTVIGKNNAVILDNISFKIPRGRSLAIIGESGSGKTTLILSIIGLLPKWKGSISNGTVRLLGYSILNLPFHDRIKLMWKKYSYVSQNSMQMFDPIRPIGPQIEEVLNGTPHSKDIITKFFSELELNKIDTIYNSYPNELSGGMLQRCSLIYGLIKETPILILDEPLSQIHKSLRKKILERILIPYKNSGKQLLLVTHDISILDSLADNLIILFRGKIIESGKWTDIKANPKHPYTELLIEIINGNYSLNSIRKKWKRIRNIK